VVSLRNCDAVASCAFRLLFDESCFELVSGQILLDMDIKDYSNGVAVAANETAINLKKEDAVKFVLRAKSTVEKSKVSCEVSVKGADDKTIYNDTITQEITVE
jgi:hypothetical protein